MSRLQITAVGRHGQFTVAGQDARALLALVRAGSAGRTALEVATWAYRFGAYVWKLRHRHGLAIETRRELHEGGWHARYVLVSPVEIGEFSLAAQRGCAAPVITAAKQAAELERRAA